MTTTYQMHNLKACI